jgi:tRNA modification GTPase
MFSTEDTIVAISTPLGRGAIGIVRLSGPEASSIAERLIGRAEPLEPRRATFARLPKLQAPSPVSQPSPADIRDQVVVTSFPSPHSYTGEDVVEISAHASPVVLQSIVQAAIGGGARLAEPGEFTLRAFLNGKVDLVQAEAVNDLINAVTPLQARAAFDQLEGTLTTRIAQIERALFELIARLEASLDFPEEGYHFVQRDAALGEIRRISQSIGGLLADAGRGRLIREGAQVAIVGTPNVGKSSLFNALLNANRAIVTPIPGTTRDLLTERANIRGISASLVDTAGIRESTDVVEREGVTRARAAVGVADLTLVVLDRSRPMEDADRDILATTRSRPRVVAVNKVDLPAAWSLALLPHEEALEISATTGDGLDTLVDRMACALGVGTEARDEPLVSNVRHAELLRVADAALTRAGAALTRDEGISEEFVLADLQEAAARLQEITGRRTTEDLLAHIFANFCIGK